ncbi:calcineurin-like phosphoesterase [Vibrio phage 1.101.O._10N.261.45.C6]|nr:calcineurin-like phosphoesterase [Vibrio phage 1.101.O._10N.261.45.C6]
MSMFGRKLRTQEQDIWITSDLHFWHKNVMKFCPKTRPWSSIEEMHEALISEWNSKVKPDDIIFSLGDFSFKGREATEEILSQLNGQKVMIMGNHCKVFRNSIKNRTFGIVDIVDYLELRINGVKVCMSHFPMTSWNQQGRESVMFYGHCHGSFQGKGKTVDVGYDNWGKIIPIQEAIDFCLQRETYCPDHHKVVEK